MNSHPTYYNRFWAKVKIGGLEECWSWNAALHSKKGYGSFHAERPDKSHRIAFRLSRGVIPVGAHVLHRCDNPGCCNPVHLFIGTNHDNVLDAKAKGRRCVGTRMKDAKLSYDKADEIRKLRAQGISFRKLGRMFGVNHSQIRRICKDLIWVRQPAQLLPAP